MRALWLAWLSTLLLAFSWTSIAAAEPKRVIALAPNLVELIYAIGAGPQLVGVVEHCNFPAEASKLPTVGNYAQLNIEQVLALKPDVVIAWRGGSSPQAVQRLEALGVTTHWLTISNFDDVTLAITELGTLLGHQQAAQQIAGNYAVKLANVRQQFHHKSALRVFYELWPQPLTTVGQGSWPQQSLELCGARNVFLDAIGEYPHVSVEHVVTAQPQIIIQPKDSARGVPLTDWQAWPQIPAVANNAMIYPDSDQLHRMTPRALDEAERLCRRIDEFRQLYGARTTKQ
ncbi:cobalamin-binding protein [Neiella sp. HB171785]|uniref:Cobalamin-binding protein n=1 Tax=Neiella litorisoli TaxID=2771431 RepID=A0A8J6UEN9_9GAMM|nr:cobalamin-binding protein [Neiella litorisoli]MBD1389684.1 cobalamin-binding protein [Neiella litorisoli]